MCCSPRGVVVACFDGVRVNLGSLVGVDGLDAARDGVPGTELLPERFTPVPPVDWSRSLYRFL